MRVAAAVLVLMAGALLCACASPSAPGPIVLAAVYNSTGPQAVLDVPSSNGSILAADQINSRGGVLGRELRLDLVDGDSQASTLKTNVTNELNGQPDVLAFFGLSDTDMVLAAAPLAAAQGRVFLTSGATSPKLPGQVPTYLYLACFGDNVQAAAGAEWAYGQLDARTAMVLFDPNQTYTTLLQGYFIDRFKQLGGTVTSAQAIDPRASSVQVPTPDNVDLVFLSMETAQDAARVIPLLRSAGYTGPILGGDGYDAESVWAQTPSIDNVYFTTHVYLGADNPSTQVKAFRDAYTAAYPGEDPSSFAALGYDSVGLLAAAIERAGQATPAAVADGLSGLQNYPGVTGTISFPGDSRIPTKSVTIMGITNGSQQFVEQVLPDSVPSP